MWSGHVILVWDSEVIRYWTCAMKLLSLEMLLYHYFSEMQLLKPFPTHGRPFQSQSQIPDQVYIVTWVGTAAYLWQSMTGGKRIPNHLSCVFAILLASPVGLVTVCVCWVGKLAPLQRKEIWKRTPNHEVLSLSSPLVRAVCVCDLHVEWVGF
jgi:hypothetical protein